MQIPVFRLLSFLSIVFREFLEYTARFLISSSPNYVPSLSFKGGDIRYYHGGQSRTLFVPLDRSKIAPMLDIRVVAFTSDGEMKDVTRSPGMPYDFTPHQIGACKMIATNDATDESREYTGDSSPGYCVELYE